MRATPDPGIEALRGVAAMLVVAVHYGHLVTDRTGFLGIASTGVDLFFVLSGFVFAPYLGSTGWSVRAHLVRRALRIYPLYLFALGVYVALRLPAADAWQHLGAHLLMLHTLGSVEVAFFYNPAFWSLPPEVEFYLLLPLFARLHQRVGFHALFWFSVALRLLLAVPFGDAAAPPSAASIATVHLPGLLVEFMLGVQAWRWSRGEAPGAPGRMLLAGVVVLAMTAVLLGVAQADPPADRGAASRWLGGMIGMLAAAGWSLVVGAACPRQVAPTSWSRWSTACALWAGHLSYGLYLLHNAAPRLLGNLSPGLLGAQLAAASLGLTLLVALAAHLGVERPLRSAGRRLSQRLA